MSIAVYFTNWRKRLRNDSNIWMSWTQMNWRNQARPHHKTLMEEDPHTNTHLPSKKTAPPSSPPRPQAPPKRSRGDLMDETESPPTKKTRLNTENGKRHLKYIANGRISRPPLRRQRTPRWRWPPFLALDPPFKQPNPQITRKHVQYPRKNHQR